jgi:hypothetical protein
MEGKQGTACQSWLIGTWPTTGDDGRVDQLFHAGAGEGSAEQVSVVVVEDHAGSAGVAVGVQIGAGHRLAGRSMLSRRTTKSGRVRRGLRSLLALMMRTASAAPTLGLCHVLVADSRDNRSARSAGEPWPPANPPIPTCFSDPVVRPVAGPGTPGTCRRPRRPRVPAVRRRLVIRQELNRHRPHRRGEPGSSHPQRPNRYKIMRRPTGPHRNDGRR